ncbi:MAG TPA: DUF2283 domain-containing protein [bacterium]|nr:DUF2283 domain-containing protein [Dictyoglomota bacterium]HHV80756.1 DUF2283 domain-containing protein [bacterium]HOK29746.1 DUF2283 domain-containing protein [bacterium]HON73250.1 DUF2283 domain-containing protein [bacterium]HOP56303.1 DUF2283 domain-containing protein [bacterium]
MKIYYDDKKDLLYIRFDEKNQQIINKRVTEDIVLDIGEEDKIVGMEILGASKLLNLRELLPVSYELETHS